MDNLYDPEEQYKKDTIHGINQSYAERISELDELLRKVFHDLISGNHATAMQRIKAEIE